MCHVTSALFGVLRLEAQHVYSLGFTVERGVFARAFSWALRRYQRREFGIRLSVIRLYDVPTQLLEPADSTSDYVVTALQHHSF